MIALYFFAVPLFFYGRHGSFMTGFYRSMLERYSHRRFYCLSVLMALLMYHFCFIAATGNSNYLWPSSLLMVAICRQTCIDRLLHLLQRPWMNAIVALASIVCASCGLHRMPLAISLAFLLLSALFYPSRKALQTLFTANTPAETLVRIYNTY
jgi:hypothetical protein